MVAVRRTGQVICSGTELSEGGKGARFLVEIDGRTLAAFAIRYKGRVCAFVNQCAHRGVELDWSEGDFFDREGDFLICATHGARYFPDTGACAGGACTGKGLTPVTVREQDGEVVMSAENTRLVGAKTQLT
ncbi:MAG: Rieske 2Fe-2S domain-containing protein [Gammaproteobacteria bacterium]|nr:MAG: Rieske 2Fe-2S domain-containing protein [Gammaproteobacteria bacterium]